MSDRSPFHDDPWQRVRIVSVGQKLQGLFTCSHGNARMLAVVVSYMGLGRLTFERVQTQIGVKDLR